MKVYLSSTRSALGGRALLRPLALGGLVLFGVSACASSQTESEEAPPPEMAPDEGDADLMAAAASDEDDDFYDPATAGPVLEIPLIPKSGSEVVGEVKLTESVEGVRVVVTASGLEPGLHGVHIHEVADCSAPDGKSAGGHYAPIENPHGIPDKETKHHLGDLGNMVVDDNGEGKLDHLVKNVSLAKDTTLSFHGRALIIHADPDTGVQPTGNSGARVACAEITNEAASLTKATADHPL